MSEQPSTAMVYMRVDTRERYKKLAELSRRSLVEELDVIAEAELQRRGFDPATLEPSAVPAASRSASD